MIRDIERILFEADEMYPQALVVTHRTLLGTRDYSREALLAAKAEIERRGYRTDERDDMVSIRRILPDRDCLRYWLKAPQDADFRTVPPRELFITTCPPPPRSIWDSPPPSVTVSMTHTPLQLLSLDSGRNVYAAYVEDNRIVYWRDEEAGGSRGRLE